MMKVPAFQLRKKLILWLALSLSYDALREVSRSLDHLLFVKAAEPILK